jgi:5-methylcytosine-specific restriction enzyme subunit McrC
MEVEIPIRNLFLLLCYAWDKLEAGRAVDVSRHPHDVPVGLFARVLESGVTHLLKRGLDRDYVTIEEDTNCLRGKLHISDSIKRNLLRQARAHCEFDELTHDIPHNQVIKATLRNLTRCDELDSTHRNRLLRLYRRLHGIEDVGLSAGLFGRVKLHRNNAHYGLLIHISRLIHDHLLIDEESGRTKFRDFSRDEKAMALLFERFVHNFYRREQSEFHVSGEVLQWQDVQASDADMAFLPRMRTDVSLISDARYIVIDTKFYRSALQGRFDHERARSEHLYQLFSYLRNIQVRDDGRPIEGILLYPTVQQDLDLDYMIQGMRMRVATVDLAADWREITGRLHGLIAA